MNASTTDATAITAEYALKPSDLAQLLVTAIAIRQPIMVWGPPGLGKSATAQLACAQAGFHHIDVRGVQMDPVDLRGLPLVDPETGRTRWAVPDFLPPHDGENYCLNLEELAACTGMVQAALYQLTLDRALGDYTLPESAAIIACGNRVNDRAVAHRMSTALASRFVHVDLIVDADDWIAWGAANGIAPETLFYITLRPEMLMDFDPKRQENAFPCPRTWEFVSRITNAQNGIVTGPNQTLLPGPLPPNIERSLYVGAVGEAAAIEYTAFLQVWRKLTHPDVIVNDPKGAAIPSDPSTLIATCGSLYRIADETNFDAVVAYARRIGREGGRPEVAQFLVSSAVTRNPKLQHSPDFIAWASEQRQAARP